MMKVITQRPSWKIATDPTSPFARPRYSPPPHTAPSWVTWVRSPILSALYSGRPHGHGGPGQDRRAAAKMPFRSAIRLAYSLHMRCRDLPWTDTSAVRSLTHTEQRNRCGLAALGAQLATRHGPHASRVAVARPPAGLRIDFGQAGPDAEHTPIPVTGFPEEVRGRRPSYRGPNRAHVCRVDQWKRAREWNSYR